MAAPMHDVGKIAIPDAILQKPGNSPVKNLIL
jgi:response regulator RpfG family c-di-GMP phosphodiesterase